MCVLKLAGVLFVHCCLRNANDKIHQLQSACGLSDLSGVTTGEMIIHLLTSRCVYCNFHKVCKWLLNISYFTYKGMSICMGSESDKHHSPTLSHRGKLFD